MTKIVIDARELRTTTGRYISSLLHYLQTIDTANDYIVLLYPKDMDSWQPTANNFKKVACKYKEFSFSEQIGFVHFLHKLRPDLVHFGMVQQPILYTGRSVTTVHDLTTVRFRNPNKPAWVYYGKLPPYWLVIQVAARKNKLLITPTEYVKKDLTAFTHINPNKIIVTLESADEIKEPAQPIQSLVGKQYIMYVGRPQPHKNLRRIIKALSVLHKKHPHLLLVLTGPKDATVQQHLHYAAQLGLQDTVMHAGWVTDGQLRWLYQNCAAYIFASLSEGFGLPGLEAMMHGAPVVSSNATCLPEVHGDAAEYFDPTDVLEMAKKIDIVISDAHLRKRLTAKGYRRVKQFSWHHMAEQTLAVYEEALGA